jgi:predicted RNase H-like nuclease (RuvC/YqgF family)
MNREDAPHLSDDRFNDLILALGTLREAIKNLNEKNERLISGPGGIMEMKQTIADKERRLENAHKAYEKLGQMYNDLADKCQNAEKKKIVLDWTENYGQGSEPWLNKE